MLASKFPLTATASREREGPPKVASVERRYIEMTGRLTRVTGSGAFAISVLVTLSCVPDLHRVAILVGIQLLQLPFNIWVNLRLLRRVGPKKGELIRNAVNIAGSVLAAHVAHWSLPAWLWLPYIALAFEQLGARFAAAALVSVCVAFDTLAFLDGVHWQYPVTFTIFAIFCAWLSKLRVEEMSEMLAAGDRQRHELERAHRAMTDAHERLTRETKARELAEIELRNAQKLEAVGHLAAGMAHEINTPVQFVGDNLRFTKDSIADLSTLLNRYRSVLSAVRDGDTASEPLRAALEAEQSLDADFLEAELPSAVDKALEGLERIASVMRSLKEFAQPEHKDMVLVDLNDMAKNVLAVSKHEYADVARVELSTSPLPPVLCNAGEINQVVLALVVNAAHAIADTPKGVAGIGCIAVRTGLEEDGAHVRLDVEDDGIGIPESLQRRLFEPFFTTKTVGKGTGQGLAVSRAVVRRHGGSLSFESTEGEGTTFTMRLPVYNGDGKASATAGVGG